MAEQADSGRAQKRAESLMGKRAARLKAKKKLSQRATRAGTQRSQNK